MKLTQNARISHHTIIGDVSATFSVPSTNDHTDGTWTTTDLYPSEIGVNNDSKKAYIRIDDEIKEFSLNQNTELEYIREYSTGDIIEITATPSTWTSIFTASIIDSGIYLIDGNIQYEFSISDGTNEVVMESRINYIYSLTSSSLIQSRDTFPISYDNSPIYNTNRVSGIESLTTGGIVNLDVCVVDFTTGNTFSSYVKYSEGYVYLMSSLNLIKIA